MFPGLAEESDGRSDSEGMLGRDGIDGAEGSDGMENWALAVVVASASMVATMKAFFMGVSFAVGFGNV